MLAIGATRQRRKGRSVYARGVDGKKKKGQNKTLWSIGTCRRETLRKGDEKRKMPIMKLV